MLERAVACLKNQVNILSNIIYEYILVLNYKTLINTMYFSLIDSNRNILYAVTFAKPNIANKM